MNATIENIEAIRLFGSYARLEATSLSDYDILVVLEKSQIVDENLKARILSFFDREVSISWYNRKRIEVMFKMGHLFAWHLFLESKPLFQKTDFITDLGHPEKYKYSYEDVWSLIEILKPIRDAVIKNPNNLIYEAGITYVCARNIALCSSPTLQKKYTFSVKAPLEMGLKMSEYNFNMLVQCRYASTRGITPPKINIDIFLKLYDIILYWSFEKLEKIKQEEIWNLQIHVNGFRKE
jgi:predicted nucleotidyltransferase